jgi:hypothetical protein
VLRVGLCGASVLAEVTVLIRATVLEMVIFLGTTVLRATVFGKTTVLFGALAIVGARVHERMCNRATVLEATVLIGATALKTTVPEIYGIIEATVLGSRPRECGMQ